MKIIATLFFVLSQKHFGIAIAELEALCGRSSIIKQCYALVKQPKRRYKNLAFTKAVYEVLFTSSKKRLVEKIKEYNLNKTINGTYCVRSSVQEKERELADYIWQKLKKPKVSLEQPSARVYFWFLQKKVFVTKQIWENTGTFFQRRATQRPGFYPASLDPQLALAMINLSGTKRNATIIDPFCGTGGILIEAALSGRRAVGYDISQWMLEKCKKNLEHYKLENCVVVKQEDATTFKQRCDVIVTELPFGKNTRSQDLESLYPIFLENAAQNTKRMVVSFPNFIDWKKIINRTRWKIKEQFLWYIHNSMSKWIVVLEKKRPRKEKK